MEMSTWAVRVTLTFLTCKNPKVVLLWPLGATFSFYDELQFIRNTKFETTVLELTKDFGKKKKKKILGTSGVGISARKFRGTV
jgi:hypothetical protein